MIKVEIRVSSLYADPETVFQQLSDQRQIAFLDSDPRYTRLAAWSVIGLRPYLRFRAWPDQVRINDQVQDENPLPALRSLLQRFQYPPPGELPLVGGCIGSLAYEAGFPLVGLPLPDRERPHQPLISFDFYDWLILFDLKKQVIHLQTCSQTMPAKDAFAKMEELLQAAVSGGDEQTGRIGRGGRGGRGGRDANSADQPLGRVIRIPQRQPYIEKVEKLRDYIRRGEVYIANYTGQLTAVTSADSRQIYRRLRRINPAPFAAYLCQDDLEWLSSSPERFLQICSQGEDLVVETRPIKGTRPRSQDRETDLLLQHELLNSEKDRSELLMIVDLERNDLSRVCRPDSVSVPELFALESYPTVHHLVATVRGILRPSADALDCLAVCFPGGSITGAPKMRAMELIDELEQQPRGYYTGCLGYLSADGQADFSILIRTMIRQGNTITYGAGGGITWESDEAAEYQEMLDKAAAFQRVISGGPAGS